jgi:hypothetical protein
MLFGHQFGGEVKAHPGTFDPAAVGSAHTLATQADRIVPDARGTKVSHHHGNAAPFVR